MNLAPRLAILERMPTFTPLGLAGEEEEDGPMPVPRGQDAAESPYASDAEQGDDAAGAVPSAGGPCPLLRRSLSSPPAKMRRPRRGDRSPEPRRPTTGLPGSPQALPSRGKLRRLLRDPESGPRLLGVRPAWRGLTPEPRRQGKCFWYFFPSSALARLLPLTDLLVLCQRPSACEVP